LNKLSKFPIAFLAALFLFAASGTKSFSQTLEQQVSADSLQAGDLFDFSITLKKDRAYDRIIYPDSTSFNSDIELRKRQQFRVTDFKDSLHYQLQYWPTDTDTIPALPVRLVSNGDTTTIYTEPVPLSFSSVMQNEEEEMRPLKPIFDFAAALWPYLVGLFVLLLAGGLIYYFYKKYRQQPESEPPPQFTPQPFLNPIKELENNLRQLKDVPLTTKEQFEQFYISLGDAIRLYFEQMYDMPALESTSREIVHELDRRAIDERMITQTRIVLREADMVKFAKFTPGSEQAKQTYGKGQEFLAITKELHGPRIREMERRHQEKVEEARQAFLDQQNDQHNKNKNKESQS
jgi:hypothetical protein